MRRYISGDGDCLLIGTRGTRIGRVMPGRPQTEGIRGGSTRTDWTMRAAILLVGLTVAMCRKRCVRRGRR